MSEDLHREMREEGRTKRPENPSNDHAHDAKLGGEPGDLSTQYTGDLLSSLERGGRGNSSVRAAVIQNMQQTRGNRATQRMVQRAARTAPASTEEDIGQKIEQRAGRGTSLDTGARGHIEKGLGANLSGVRVHTDGEADSLARSVDAVAFTSGQDIFFRQGAYNPGTQEGMKLIAHEATHTVQQSQGPVAGTPSVGGVSVSDPSDSFEQAADRAAESVVGGVASQRASATGMGPALQRQPNPEEEEDEQPVQMMRASGSALHIQRHAGHNHAEEEGPPVQTMRALPLVVQRHPAGAALLPNKEQEVAENLQPPPAEGLFSRIKRFLGAGPGSSTQTGGTPGTTPGGTAGGTQTTTGGSPTGSTATPATPGTTPATGATPSAPGATPSTTPAPAPSSPYFMELARGQEILNAVYGKAHNIVPGNMVVLDNNDAILAKYDEVCIADNITNPRTGEPWKAGDALATNPFGLNGFQWKGAVYINRMTTSPTTTCHEMLHLNTEAGFRAAVGETVNEGATQYLTINALRNANVELPASLPYAEETALVTKLARLVGQSTLIQAYFGGAQTLIDAVERAMGPGKWAEFKALADARNFAGAAEVIDRPVGDFPTPPSDTAVA